ncbi:TetR/AcrR family transcriptional regulator [Nonomuraea sp. NPDC003214]
MTNLADRPNSIRGDWQREQVVETGLTLLGEHQRPGVTACTVAERAGTSPSLIHYHFGGLPGLHTAISRRGTDLLVSPLIDERAAPAPIRGLLLAATGDEPRLAAAAPTVAECLLPGEST